MCLQEVSAFAWSDIQTKSLPLHSLLLTFQKEKQKQNKKKCKNLIHVIDLEVMLCINIHVRH